MEIEDRVLVFLRYTNYLTGEERTAIGGMDNDLFEFMKLDLTGNHFHFPFYKEVQKINHKFIPAY